MEINIPRNLAGVEAQGGPGGAMMQVGESISRAGNAVGGFLDNIQKNYDYNAFTEIEKEFEPKLQEHYLTTTAKDDGSNPKAFEEYQKGREKILDEAHNKARKINQRVGDFTKKHFTVRSVQYDHDAQKAFYGNMIKKSVTVDNDQAMLSLDAALGRDGSPFENVNAAIEENKVKIFAREGLYGANTKTVFDGAISNAMLVTLDNGLKDPDKSRKIIEMLKDPAAKEKIMGYISPEHRGKVLGLLKVMQGEVTLRNGMDIGTKIFKDDKTGSIEAMTDAVRALKLDVDTEKNAITQIKELVVERRTDEVKRAKDAVDTVNAILNPIALKRRGINRVSDLTPTQWAELTRDNPEYAKQLQDNMRREADYEIRLQKQDALAARQERALEQSENEQTILLDDDFRSRDLKSDYATGKISTLQFNRLRKLQESMDPMKSNSVKAALSRINTGGALAAALGGLEKNEEAQWKMKYSELVKAFAENNIDDPNFDQKLTDFMEKHVFSEMANSWFVPDFMEMGANRIDKYETAKKAADPMRNQAIDLLRANKKPVTEGNIRHVIKKLRGR